MGWHCPLLFGEHGLEGVGGDGEIANVSHTLKPSGRCEVRIDLARERHGETADRTWRAKATSAPAVTEVW